MWLEQRVQNREIAPAFTPTSNSIFFGDVTVTPNRVSGVHAFALFSISLFFVSEKRACTSHILSTTLAQCAAGPTAREGKTLQQQYLYQLVHADAPRMNLLAADERSCLEYRKKD
jgi:hypothetical protein